VTLIRITRIWSLKCGEDGWREGAFVYSGEGQVGDMVFTGGNKAIRDHVSTGKELHLFKRTIPAFVRYEGEFTCTSWEYAAKPDNTGATRQAIVFHLVPADSTAELEVALEQSPGNAAPTTPLAVLRERALAAAAPAEQAEPKDARRKEYERSRAVRQYVLARANGVCEACGGAAPFQRKDGSPYLEPHHTRRISDAGPDHPRFVAGICPTCHRKVHYGLGGDAVNELLEKKLSSIEQ
jgi:5-methylcytosine-specific restriction protein A